MIRKYIFPLVLTTIALFCASVGCTRETLNDRTSQAGSDALLLQLQVAQPEELPAAQSALRATEAGEDAYNENTISSVTVLFYKGGQLFWQSRESGQGGITPDAGVTTPGHHYIIPVPDDKKAQLNGVNSFNVYVVCNKGSFSAPTTEVDLLKVLVTNDVSAVAPTNFVMLGSASNKQIDMSTQAGRNLGSISLKRVASKVRILQPVFAIENYVQVGDVQVKLRNYANQGYLGTGENVSTTQYNATDYRSVNEVIAGGKKSAHFYSYYNEWTQPTDLAHRPEFVVMARLKKVGEADSQAKTYYYKAPIEPAQKKLESNKLYELSLRIEVIGSPTSEDPEPVSGTVSIEPWTLHDDTYNLPKTEFLVVDEHNIVMKNVTQYSVLYRSSNLPVTLTIKKVYCTFVDDQGVLRTTNYTPGQPEYPTITNDAELIHITSSIPVNNVPKYIEFEVTNGVAGLVEKVTVKQVPAIYIEHTMGIKSSMRPNGTFNPGYESHLNNKAMYRIQVLVPPAGMVVGYPIMAPKIFYDGLINKGTHDLTEDNLETSKMLSPCFELASQLGANWAQPYISHKGKLGMNYPNKPQISHPSAIYHCATYTETRRRPDGSEEVLDDWRLPTEAEIRLIDQLQNDAQSAVKRIMTGRYYWDCYSANNATLMSNSGGPGANLTTATNASVRCVRDVKDNTVDR
mgnify:FL=1